MKIAHRKKSSHKKSTPPDGSYSPLSPRSSSDSPLLATQSMYSPRITEEDSTTTTSSQEKKKKKKKSDDSDIIALTSIIEEMDGSIIQLNKNMSALTTLVQNNNTKTNEIKVSVDEFIKSEQDICCTLL